MHLYLEIITVDTADNFVALFIQSPCIDLVRYTLVGAGYGQKRIRIFHENYRKKDSITWQALGSRDVGAIVSKGETRLP